MRHVDDEPGADLARYFGERLEVDDPRVGARSGDYHLRLPLARDALHRGVVDSSVVAHSVVNRIVQQAGKIHRRAVGEVATLRQVEPENGVAGLEEGEV